jgi:signal transduction histidine kinase
MGDFLEWINNNPGEFTPDQLRELLISAAGKINRLETVADSINVGILVCDEKHLIIMANKCARRFLSLTYFEKDKIWNAVLDEQIAGFFKDTLLENSIVHDREIELFQYDRNRLLSVNIVPLVQNRKITGSLIYMEDITEKRKKESRLRRAENLASLTTLAAAVAHEIKNPLGSISIHLQLLQKTIKKKYDSSGKSTDRYFKVLKEEIERLNRIIVDFLFAVRPMSLELRVGNINSLISEVIDFTRYEMEKQGIRCFTELDENIAPVLIDKRYMKQAILNLIKNSQTAMADGGILTIATKYADNEIQISISDTGTGIKKDDIVKIFEPYFTTSETGTGLGLTLVYKIIREHHGEISVSSTEENGAVFEITLPVYQKEKRLIAYNEGV